jgi:hypothetical protein
MSALRVLTLIALSVAASPALAQSTPGQINDPSTFSGSLANQAAEQARSQEIQAQNDAMLQRLDQSYAAYAPGGGSGGGGAVSVPPLKSRPLLPPDRNPLIGRWQQMPTKPVEMGWLRALPGASIVDAALAGGCESIFGRAGIAFTPTQLNWVAEDGHEEILNHVEYRSNGADIIVLASDGDLPLIFGLTDNDHAVAAFLGCQMRRLEPKARPVTVNTAPATSAASSASAAGSAILNLTVGSIINGIFSSPPAGTRIFITNQNPDSNLVSAGFAPDSGGQPIEKLFDACSLASGGTQERCNQAMQALAMGTVAITELDPNGHAETEALVPGRYYVVSFVPYQGHSLIWHLPVDLEPGANSVVLSPENGSISR